MIPKAPWIYAVVSVLLVALVLPLRTESGGGTQKSQDGLASHLVTRLGVTEPQAEGGAGAILQLAKSRLNAEDFGKVAGTIPDAGKLLKAAPAQGPIGGLGSVTSLGGLAGLAGSFQKLGLSPDMVTKFAPEVLSFVESKGGSSVKGLLAGALK